MGSEFEAHAITSSRHINVFFYDSCCIDLKFESNALINIGWTKLGLGRVLKNGIEYLSSHNRPEFE